MRGSAARAVVWALAGASLFSTACGAANDSPTAPAAVMSPPGQQPVAPLPVAPTTARYRMVFDATWTDRTHPLEAPPNPHFSPLVGGTHSQAAVFWREDGLATEGIRRMAERGDVSPMDTEIRAAITAGTADGVIVGDGISSPKTTALEFDISSDFPLVTMVTMVAPSPDWFVGVTGLALYTQGVWTSDLTVALVPWDAGTDSGTSFLSPDSETLPHQPISRIAGGPLAAGGTVQPLGTFRFTRIH